MHNSILEINDLDALQANYIKENAFSKVFSWK